MESSKPGQWKPVKVAPRVSPSTSGLPSQPGVRPAPMPHMQDCMGRAPREYRSGHLHAAGLYQVQRERERPEACELKRESNQCSRSFPWVKNRKAMSINTCISKLLQPVLSIPCNLFLSCAMMPESKSHLPQVIITLSQQETCCMLLHPLQPSTT